MIPPAFEYVRPTSVDDAVRTLAGTGEDAKVLAGGQSLLPLLRMRLAFPELLVDVGRIPGLRGVREEGDALVVGALTSHHDVIADPLVRHHAGLLAAAAATVADPAIRHRGTLGGSLAHADPGGDLPAVALALDAELIAAGPGGRRTIPAREFFVDFLRTALRPDELLVEIRVPKTGEYDGWGFHYEKFSRVAQAWAMVGVAALVRREDGHIAEARIGLTNMGTTPLRASAAEEALAGVGPDGVARAAQAAAEGTRPASDPAASAEYRAQLARVLTRRSVLAAAGMG
ncbi:FAD binding domain-containing protein [Streptomyces sp. NPDC127119]|uniref:FAD binding domain-containing protein n=1 Tax=Streptomyces sp. NPDC127119 TaxID=3345370 RepID=UPI0036298E57